MKNHPTHPDLHLDEAGVFWLRLRPTHDGAGYQLLTIPQAARSGPRIRDRLHRLIWEVEHQQAVPAGRVVRHLNDVNTDNRPENLALGSQAANVADAVRNGLQPVTNAKITREQALEIYNRRMAGERLKAIAADYGISDCRVCDIAKGRTKWLAIAKEGNQS
jgi:hypothetical protein